MFGSTRDMALKAQSSIESHIVECGKQWASADKRMEELAKDFERKHTANQHDRQVDRQEFERFQRRLLVCALMVVLSVAVKGTNWDVLGKIIGSM